MPIRNQIDFATGTVFILLGGGAVATNARLPFGSTASFGPGYFPVLVGAVLVVLGVVLLALGLVSRQQRRLPRVELRELALILGSIALFGIMIEPAGMLVSIPVLVILSSLSSPEFSWRTSLTLAAVLTAMAYLIFIEGIELQIPVLPEMFR